MNSNWSRLPQSYEMSGLSILSRMLGRDKRDVFRVLEDKGCTIGTLLSKDITSAISDINRKSELSVTKVSAYDQEQQYHLINANSMGTYVNLPKGAVSYLRITSHSKNIDMYNITVDQHTRIDVEDYQSIYTDDFAVIARYSDLADNFIKAIALEKKSGNLGSEKEYYTHILYFDNTYDCHKCELNIIHSDMQETNEF